jgi:phage N-6-adenine-methyltransferase
MAKKALTAEVMPRQLSLDELADVANEEHLQCVAAMGSVLEHAIKAGDALALAKAQLKHGEWLQWLGANFNASQVTASAYMRVAANYKHASNLEPSSIRQALKMIAGGDDPHVSNNSGNNEWYTPEDYVAAARDVLGGIDLDPASSAEANEIVQAEDFYTIDDDGLEQEWRGRVWMNPPYAQPLIGEFTEKLADSFEQGKVDAAISLVNNATETQWFQRLARNAAAICFPDGRIRFWNPETKKGAPLQGQAFVYHGHDVSLFMERFAQIGLVVEVRAA